MSASEILLGRGIVTYDGLDLGLCSTLTLRHEVEQAGIAMVDSLKIGGSGEIATRTRVFVDFTIHELSAQNRGIVWALSDSLTPAILQWNGVNKMNVDLVENTCFAHILNVPLFVVFPAAASPLIADSLTDSAIRISGEALRAEDNPVFYTFP